MSRSHARRLATGVGSRSGRVIMLQPPLPGVARRYTPRVSGSDVMRPALLLAALACACAPEATIDLPETEVVYEGLQVRLHAVPERTACGGNGPAMEAMLTYFAEESGLGPLEAPIDTYLLTPAQVDEVCYVGYLQPAACAFSAEDPPFAVAGYMPTEHELVHAYLSAKQGGAGRWSFFDEGLATVYGRDATRDRPSTPLQDAIVYQTKLPLEHYPRAAHFVAYLIERFGPQATIRFVMDTASVQGDVELATVFLASFAVSLPSTIAAYEAETEACTVDGWQRIYDCEEPAIAWPESGTLRLEIGAQCEDSAVLGVAEQLTFERFVVEVPAPGPVSIELGSRVQVRAPRVRLVRCGSCEEEFVVAHDLADGRLEGAWLRAGTYVVTVEAPTGEPEVGVLELWWE